MNVKITEKRLERITRTRHKPGNVATPATIPLPIMRKIENIVFLSLVLDLFGNLL